MVLRHTRVFPTKEKTKQTQKIIIMAATACNIKTKYAMQSYNMIPTVAKCCSDPFMNSWKTTQCQ